MRRGLHGITRRKFLQSVTAAGITAAFGRFAPTYAASAARRPASPEGTANFNISVEEMAFSFNGRKGTAVAMNGTIPGPLLRFREGEETVIRVTNRLREDTSIHWHGILLPANMDGVPGVSFAGIKPGETFTYRFTLKQSGTYWYHSHSAMQEQSGQYGRFSSTRTGRSLSSSAGNTWSCSPTGRSKIPKWLPPT
jgi:FtsP/CotA-like multicopper oxidase with cupredoxin domain